MNNRYFWVSLVCVTVLLFITGAVSAAPMGGEQMDHSKMMNNVITAADKFLKMAPEMGFYRFNVKDLKMKVDSGGMDFAIIDVRPANAFAMEHIPDAINVPLPMLMDKLNMIPMNKTIYVVCAVDSNSSYATAVLRMLGYNAFMVPGGEGAWKDMGYPLTMGAQ